MQRRCRDAARWIWRVVGPVVVPPSRRAFGRARAAVEARPALTVAIACTLLLVALGASPTPRPALVLHLSAPPSPSASPVTSSPATPSPPPGAAPSSGRVYGGPGGSAQLTGTAGVALTFDDGPDPVNTPRLLDLLKQHGVKATFCLVGFRARDHPDLVQRIAAEGHTLCNHSWQHDLRLALKPPDAIRADLEATNNAIRNAAPGAQVKYFRAPGGNFTTGLVGIAQQLGMASIYWWVDPRDWDDAHDPSAQAHIARVAAAVRTGVKSGAIVLSHDNGQPDTIVAYQQLVPWLKSRFTLVAMPV